MILLRRASLFKIALALFIGAVFLLIPKAYVQSASLYFSPSSIKKLAGEAFAVTIRVNTDAQAINAAEGSVVFSNDKVEVVSVSKTGSIFSLWTQEPTFSNPEGTVDFGGGIPNPGYSGSSGLVLTINFRAKTATTVKGYTDILLVSGAVLSNDGEGTNVLSSLGKCTLYIGPGGVYDGPIPPPSATTPAPSASIKAPVVTSSTYPDSTKWYNIKDGLFNWEIPAGVQEVRLALSQDPKEAPHVRYSPPISEKSLPGLDDGVWYLNALFRTAQGLSPTTSFKFQIDTVPPEAFKISSVNPNEANPKISFSAQDALSGIDHYEIKIDDGGWTRADKSAASSSYELPKLKEGEHRVSVRAFDAAGNFSEDSTTISVPKGPSWTKNIYKGFDLVVNGISINWAIILFVLLVFAIVFLLLDLFNKSFRKLVRSINNRRALAVAERASYKKFAGIIGDIQEEINFIETIAKRRRLNPEEKYLKTKLESYLKTLKMLDKE